MAGKAEQYLNYSQAKSEDSLHGSMQTPSPPCTGVRAELKGSGSLIWIVTKGLLW